MIHEPPAIHPLQWDSEFFSVSVARATGSRMTRDDADRLADAARASDVVNLQILVDLGDDETIRTLEASGYHLTDTRITFARQIRDDHVADSRTISHTRPSRQDDVETLASIARTNHRDSRFYYDGGFPHERCDDLFETWITRSCEGWADHVIVADTGNGAAGYISCHLRGENAGQIGLVGVGNGYQGKGLGGNLVAAAIDWFAAQGCRSVDVVTQGRNINAQKLYQRAGFVTSAIGHWYHRWFTPRQGRS